MKRTLYKPKVEEVLDCFKRIVNKENIKRFTIIGALATMTYFGTIYKSQYAQAQDNYEETMKEFSNISPSYNDIQLPPLSVQQAIYDDNLLKDLTFDKDLHIPILMYHEVVNEGEQIKSPDLVVTVQELKKQLQYLKKEGYTTISLEEYYKFMTDNKPLPKKSIAITFDDGYVSFYNLVYPILKELNMKVTLAIVTEHMGEGGYYHHATWEQIKEMQANELVEIVSHTKTHPYLAELVGNTATLRNEINGSDKDIGQNTGKESDILVYPYGSYNEEVIEATKSEYKMGVTIGKGVNRYGDNLMEIKRLGVNHGDTGEKIIEEIKNYSK